MRRESDEIQHIWWSYCSKFSHCCISHLLMSQLPPTPKHRVLEAIGRCTESQGNGIGPSLFTTGYLSKSRSTIGCGRQHTCICHYGRMPLHFMCKPTSFSCDLLMIRYATMLFCFYKMLLKCFICFLIYCFSCIGCLPWLLEHRSAVANNCLQVYLGFLSGRGIMEKCNLDCVQENTYGKCQIRSLFLYFFNKSSVLLLS